jgi:hypothetical protein
MPVLALSPLIRGLLGLRATLFSRRLLRSPWIFDVHLFLLRLAISQRHLRRDLGASPGYDDAHCRRNFHRMLSAGDRSQEKMNQRLQGARGPYNGLHFQPVSKEHNVDQRRELPEK